MTSFVSKILEVISVPFADDTVLCAVVDIASVVASVLVTTSLMLELCTGSLMVVIINAYYVSIYGNYIVYTICNYMKKKKTFFKNSVCVFVLANL